VAEALLAAKKEIYIEDWWLSPELVSDMDNDLLERHKTMVTEFTKSTCAVLRRKMRSSELTDCF
jgi:hypothetical protein